MIVGEASESQYGAFSPNGELMAPAIVPFSKVERERMAAGEFSSNEREITALLRTVHVILDCRPDLV